MCCRSADSLRGTATPDGADAKTTQRISPASQQPFQKNPLPVVCVCCRSADSLRSAATPDGADAEIAERISLGMVRSSGGKDDTPAPLRMHCVRRLMLQLIRATRPSEQWAAPIRHDHLAGSTDETSASLRMHGARTSDASAHHGSPSLRSVSCHRSGSHVTGARTRLQLLSECTVLARLMLHVITAAHPLTSERIS